MSVSIKQFAKIKGLDDKEYEGEILANELFAVKSGEEVYYGVVQAVRLRTRAECDYGKCAKGQMNDRFEFEPNVIEFDDTGNPAEYIKEAAEIIKVTTIDGVSLVFCSAECAAGHLRKIHKLDGSNIVHFPEIKKRPTGLLVPDRG